MKIKIRLKEILEERGMSQRQLSLLMNIRHATINHLCSDNVDRVYIRTLEQICEALNITVDQLIVSVDDNEPSDKSVK
ncbi:helix-turn-helix transcriptional regulator [Paenibacillus melissococcoides]|uniref:Helix-turn-helix transcriptional regulator n=1 Tax=Paenibacillus melissococcoides TaxID=2912268 RepID=A0ABM9G7T3_9BACL|nr:MULTISPECIES: helix-turn-helix transcriptional regulator [Paenibacillus]MEB9896263.1 helix-turn-helix transcriptional regulator [Bacillus cereus]CAH8247827.1 helix-turn-helix transcriptional regulator [Paenibacillus melissococcoides]CAH8719423.1 helix-turn-helix transcriptional regulator [Paenibacillus melissococcoides]CAH8720431.1 helix-turn-helix transcriptional regulator [Paenibacillus melissococcoides]